jgi:peptide methionine sulfoxide reductase MsrB
LKAVKDTNPSDLPIKFYDSVTGALLFEAPKGRSMDDFLKESASHGWPSFRDEEVNWEHVRCLKNGECISTTGTHLGHNLPDRSGNRYCINLVSVAGEPED